jgi:hypothetical protein
MVCGLQKYAGEAVRQRGSSPKLQVFNTALMTAQSIFGLQEAKADREYWGHLAVTAGGGHTVSPTSPPLRVTLIGWGAINRRVAELLSARAPDAKEDGALDFPADDHYGDAGEEMTASADRDGDHRSSMCLFLFERFELFHVRQILCTAAGALVCDQIFKEMTGTCRPSIET